MSLIKPVVRALAATGLTQKELLGGAIEHTDLGWQVPALACQYELEGTPLQMYFDRPTTVNVTNLYAFWQDALLNLRNAPYKVIGEDGWRQLSYVLPRSTKGERAMCFSTPEGFPRNINDYAGVTLSMECAHLLRHSSPVVEVVESDDDYYVTTSEGLQLGVKDGLPMLFNEAWDIPVNGMVREMLQMPRGGLYVGCDYDLISKLRSVAYERRERLKDFHAVDTALQTLRVLAAGAHLPELQTQINRLNFDMQRNHLRLKAFTEAVELSNVYRISDRARVTAIRALLVPDFMTMPEFKKKIYHSPQDVPAIITENALRKLRDNLETLLMKARLGS